MHRSQLRIFAVLGAFLVCAGGASLLYFYCDEGPDPIYEGKRLSRHLLGAFPLPLIQGNFSSASVARLNLAVHKIKQEDARAVLKALGPKASPLLASWLTKDSSFNERVRALLAKYDLWCPRFLQDRSFIALWAIREAPETGVDLVPIFREWVEQGSSSRQYTGTVVLDDIVGGAGIGPRKIAAHECLSLIPLLLKRTADPNYGSVCLSLAKKIVENAEFNSAAERERLIRSILAAFPNRFASYAAFNSMADILGASSALRSQTLLQPGLSSEKIAAAIHFSEKGEMGDLVVPLLISCLSSTNASLQVEAIDALLRYGTAARTAIPSLSNLLSHNDPEVAQEASHVIEYLKVASLAER